MSIILNKTYIKKNINNFHLLEITVPKIEEFKEIFKKFNDNQTILDEVYQDYVDPEYSVIEYIKENNHELKNIYFIDWYESEKSDVFHYIVESINFDLKNIKLPLIDLKIFNNRYIGEKDYLEIKCIYTLGYNKIQNSIVYGDDYQLCNMEEFIEILQDFS